MTTRCVTRTRKDGNRILALCNPDERWSPRKTADAIRDIETGRCTYYVRSLDGARTAIRVVEAHYPKYLRTDRDGTTLNNLGDLPNC